MGAELVAELVTELVASELCGAELVAELAAELAQTGSPMAPVWWRYGWLVVASQGSHGANVVA